MSAHRSNTTHGPENRGAKQKKIVLVAKHFGHNAGGEAIKAYQFAAHLRRHGAAVVVITHARALAAQGGDDLDVEKIVVPDTGLQRVFWRVPLLRGLLDTHFHLAVRRLIRAHVPPNPDTVLHYIGPVSPVQPRFFPRGYDVVLGPLTGNISYPPAFRHRMSWRARLSDHIHKASQMLLGWTLREKQRSKVILVSGYERTRASLRAAGARDDQMVDVVDSGVSDRIYARNRASHVGINPRFVCSGRMVDHKGVDLAIRAMARTDPSIRLDIYGDGEKRAALEALAASEGVAERVRFLGWIESDDLLDALANYRGYVFPTLAEANGIVMQEAMMMGLPVIATRWGGPEKLADDDAAWYVDPVDADAMIASIAEAMTCLAHDPERAERLSRNARSIAEARFPWDAVSRSWMDAAYGPEPLVELQSDERETDPIRAAP